MKNVGIMGGAGFIGRQLTMQLLSRDIRVFVYDNFSSGTQAHVNDFQHSANFSLHRIDIENTTDLIKITKGLDTVIHLASNADISRAQSEPRIDFAQGTVLTESVAEVCRINKVKTVLYASGSGVYGDAGETILDENSPLRPISTYGASKLAGEALFASYSYMFGIDCIAFRFANVVGPMQTHGVGYDFLRKLSSNPNVLDILGDGSQRKSYVHVSDVIAGIFTCYEKRESGFEVYNIATDDDITVTEIAEMAVGASSINGGDVKFIYSGGDRGWKADVPIVRLDSRKIKNLGWTAKMSSKEAIFQSLREQL
jgi:UDP-glucose 4-epimerase